jgi:F-type H+-transporting ATPase subunit epsilon
MTFSEMTLKILLPNAMFLDEKVIKVKGEGYEGEFCLKPKHIDYATALVPGIFSYIPASSNTESFIALDHGILVKQGLHVFMVTRRAIAGELGQLNDEVKKMLIERDERDRQNRSAVAMLEIGFIKRFLEFSHRV